MRRHLSRILEDERGATSIEYALLGVLVSASIIVGASTVGASVSATFQSVADALVVGSGNGKSNDSDGGGNGNGASDDGNGRGDNGNDGEDGNGDSGNEGGNGKENGGGNDKGNNGVGNGNGGPTGDNPNAGGNGNNGKKNR